MFRSRWVFRLLTAATLLGLGAWLSSRFPVLESLDGLEHAFRQSPFANPWLYPLLIAGCNLLLLPGGVLTMCSGLLFGLWWGFGIALLGNVIGASAAFLVSRSIGRAPLERRCFANPKWRALDHAIAKQGWQIIFLSQVHPLFPTSLLNYLYGITKIRFSTCVLWIALGQAPGLFLYAYIGTLCQLGVRYLHGQTHPKPIEFLHWGTGLALSFLITLALGRIALRLLREACSPAHNQTVHSVF